MQHLETRAGGDGVDPQPRASVWADLQTLWRYLAVAAVPRRSDVLFCFGSFHFGIARRAAALYHEGVAPVVLVSGGRFGRIAPYPTEADGYVAVLQECGVPDSHIVVERRAEHTGENVALGMQELARQHVDVNTASLIAWPISLRRCAATFARQFPDVATQPIPAFDGLGPYSNTPRRAVDMVLAELDRLRDYPDCGYIVEQRIPDRVSGAARRLAESAHALRLDNDG